ncbi:MAG: TetR-like C-terminal domain-containing protein [Anaerolineales bacterium]
MVLPSSVIFPSDEADPTPQENGRRLFEYLGEQEELFSVLFQERPLIHQSVLDLARQKTIDILQNMLDEHDSPIPFRIMANHVMISTIELMKLWLEDGKPYSADEMRKYLVQTVFKPMRNLLSEVG